MSALNTFFKMIMADPAAKAEMAAMMADAPTVTRKPAKGKRKGNPEALRKWRESQKAAKAAGVVTKPKRSKAAKPANGTTVTGKGWSVRKGYTTKRGKIGRIVTVGPLSCFVEDGNADQRKALADAINTVFRTGEATALWAGVIG